MDTQKQLYEYHLIIQKLWNFMKEWISRSHDRRTDPDKYWSDMVEQYKAETNGEGEFIHKLYVTAIRELERIDKEERKDD